MGFAIDTTNELNDTNLDELKQKKINELNNKCSDEIEKGMLCTTNNHF